VCRSFQYESLWSLLPGMYWHQHAEMLGRRGLLRSMYRCDL
jgi:hypothetical protein